MKKILNFSRVAVALFCFMLIGISAKAVTTIVFTPDPDINPAVVGTQICTNTSVTFTATVGVH